MDVNVLNCGMNDKQKWFIVVAVGCVSAIVMALLFDNIEDTFEVINQTNYEGPYVNWTGCVLFGMLCSSITGFFLFKDK